MMSANTQPSEVPQTASKMGHTIVLGVSDSQHFIRGKFELLPRDDVNLSFFLATYDLSQYEQSLFHRYAIEMPASVARSVPRRQAEFLAGRICAQSILKIHGHTNHTVSIGAYREPIWPEGIVGSITHTGRHAAAAICSDTNSVRGIGIDIEPIIGPDKLDDVRTLIISPEELNYLDSRAHAADSAYLLTLCFSAKECFFKAAFASVNDYFGFEAVEIIDIDLERRCLYLRCTRNLGHGFPKDSRHEIYFKSLDEATILTAGIFKF